MTLGSIVKLGKAHPSVCKGIQVWSVYLATITAEVGKPRSSAIISTIFGRAIPPSPNADGIEKHRKEARRIRIKDTLIAYQTHLSPLFARPSFAATHGISLLAEAIITPGIMETGQ